MATVSGAVLSLSSVHRKRRFGHVARGLSQLSASGVEAGYQQTTVESWECSLPYIRCARVELQPVGTISLSNWRVSVHRKEKDTACSCSVA